jgi:imidazolonepropionase-like amidohydrolase
MIAYINATIEPVSSSRIDQGLVLTSNGKIDYVGPMKEFSDQYDIVDCENKYILPGLIDNHTHIGIWGEGEGAMSFDGNEATNPITPSVRAIDSININHTSFKDALAGGVTTVCITPGSSNNIGGMMCASKTAGCSLDDMIINDYVGMKAALGENPKGFYGKELKKFPSTRMGNAYAIRKTLMKVKDLLEKDEDIEFELKPLVKVLNREVPLRVHAHRADDILTAIRISEEFNLDLQIEHGTDGARIADKLAGKKVKINLGPSFWNRAKIETQSISFDTAKVLDEAGVEFAIISDHPFFPIQYANIQLALTHAHGLSREQTLKAYSLNPAKFMNIDHMVGSLEKGKDADLTIWSGDPFSIYTKLEKTIVNGKVYYTN